MRIIPNSAHKISLSRYGNKTTSSMTGSFILMATQPLSDNLRSRSQLPSWNRSGLGARASTIKTLSRDRLSLASQAQASLEHSPAGARAERSHEGQRVLQLEKNIMFIKRQHLETLRQLHEETERLKKENRGQFNPLISYCINFNLFTPELNFRLIMCRCEQTGRPHASKLEIQYVCLSGNEEN